MNQLFNAALAAIDDMRAPGMLGLFLKCLGLTVIASAVVIFGGYSLVSSWLAPFLEPLESMAETAWLGFLLDAMIGMIYVAAFILPVFLLFWSLMIFIASFFDEAIADKIEQSRYPHMALGQNRPFLPELWQDVLFTLTIIGMNILLIAIPLFWPFWPFLFPLLNGYALGMYFFIMAGGRHIGRKEAKKLAKKNRWPILLAGLAIVFASGVPFLNLLVPFWGVAMMVHLYHAIGKPPVVEMITQQT